MRNIKLFNESVNQLTQDIITLCTVDLIDDGFV